MISLSGFPLSLYLLHLPTYLPFSVFHWRRGPTLEKVDTRAPDASTCTSPPILWCSGTCDDIPAGPLPGLVNLVLGTRRQKHLGGKVGKRA